MQHVKLDSPRFKSKNACVIAALAASVSLTGCGFIGNPFGGGGDSDHDGRFYVGAGGLVSKLEPDTSESTLDLDETQSAGGSVAIGYDISNRFSLEGHLASLGEATLVDPATSATEPVGYTVGGLSVLAYLLNDAESRGRREGLNLYGRLGAGFMENEVDDSVGWERVNNGHLMFGAGIEYGFESGLGVRAEAVSHDADALYAQLGLVYRFGDIGDAKPAVAVPEVAAIPTPTAPIVQAPVDSDTDGVEDSLDQCPGTAVGSPVNPVGCEVFNGVIEGVNFASGSDKLTRSAEEVLDSVAATLQQYPDVRISIEAHTDNQGDANANLQLSKRRAIAVARYLVNQGIQGGRLQPRAFGESRPIASNATPGERAQNRRVEFQVVN